jgi:RNA recognition motif-containing protein
VYIQIKEEKPDLDDEDDDEDISTSIKSKKIIKPGIIYLSTIPPKMNVLQIREYFSAFGPINKSFMQPDKSIKQNKNI